jgi:glycolate dehydrogenase FAD-binding subunit
MDPELLQLRDRVLAARAAGVSLRLRGGGTKDFYGELLIGELLDVSGYRGIIDYEPSELVIRARCGTPLEEIEAALAERGQFLGFEPPRFRREWRPDGAQATAIQTTGVQPTAVQATGTLGGAIATGLSGPRRMQTGAARDFVLGVSLLGADGEVLRFGGQVMKNVAGFDVSRLLCGSLGILGVMTEVSIKVLPKPRVEETLRLEISQLRAIEAFNRWAGKPLPISAAAWYGGCAWVRLSGAAAAVATARDTIGGERVSPSAAQLWWDGLRDYTHPAFKPSPLWRVSVPSTTPPLQISSEALVDWGGALRWYGGDLTGWDVRALAVAAGGSAMRWHGEGAGSRFHPLSPAVAAIHERLKSRFDPTAIFNRGRLLAHL